MRRLALTLATAVLASGCIIGDDDNDHVGVGSAIVYWDFLRNAPAQGGTGTVLYDDATLVQTGTGPCAQSGVEFVTIDVAGLQQFVVDCVYQGVQGATLDGLPAGSLSARIRAGAADVVVHDTTVALQVFDGQETDQGIIDVDPVRAPLDLFGDLAFGLAPTLYASCAEADEPEHLVRAVRRVRNEDRRGPRRLLGSAAGARVHRRPRPRQLHRPDAGDRARRAPFVRPDGVRLLRGGVRSLRRPGRGDRGSS